MSRLFAPDTNILMREIERFQDYKFVILSHVLRELEKHKSSNNELKAYQARVATRYIRANRDRFHFDAKDYDGSEIGDKTYQDNNILKACLENSYGLITADGLMEYKAEGLGIEVIWAGDDNNSNDKIYNGVYDLYISNSKEDQQILASVYENLNQNIFNLVKNQYLYIWDKEKPHYKNGKLVGYEFIDNFKFDGEKLTKLKFKPIQSRYSGEKVKPINRKQEMLFDMLQNKESTIKCCLGKFGVGKDYVMISHALELVESQKMDKIIWARNNVELADVPTLGILPGDKIEKLIEFAMPLADHVGGLHGLEMLIRENKIEIQHLGSLRGRDIKKSIIYVTECQNNTKEHVKLLIGRVGRDSQLWLNGDLKQTDKDIYKNNSGIRALSKLKGHELFDQVTLDKTERSDTAELADLLD